MANPYFNAQYYLTQNPDLIAAGINTADAAWAHYVNYGAAEALNGVSSRAPAPWFDVKYYVATYPDLVTSGLTPAQMFEHFVTYGINEGRAPSAAAQMTEANLLAYAKGNADLLTAFDIPADATSLTDAQQDALANHYYEHGYQENRPDAPFTPDVPGQTFTLTAGVDTFQGTAANDTFNAALGTLQATDTLVGGGGDDVLNATLTTAASTPVLDGIETLNLTTIAAGGTLNLASTSGATSVNAFGAGALTLTNVDQTTTKSFGLNNYNSNLSVTVNSLAGTTAAGTAEELSLALSGTGTNATATLAASAAGVLETLNIASNGSAANTLNLSAGAGVNGIAKMVVTGAADLDLRGTAATFNNNTLDAAAHTGALAIRADFEGAGALVGLNAAKFAGVDSYVVTDLDGGGASADAFGLFNIANESAVRVADDFLLAATDSIISVTGAAAGSSDSVSINLQTRATTPTDVDLTGLVVGNVENITINSTGAATTGANAQNSVGNLTAGALQNLVLTGDSSLSVTLANGTITAANTSNITVDGSALTGQLTFSAGNLADTAAGGRELTIKGGTGNDVLTGSTVVAVKDVFDLSAGGNDRVNVALNDTNDHVIGFGNGDVLALGAGGKVGAFVNGLNSAVINAGNQASIEAAGTLAAAAGVVNGLVGADDTAVLFSYQGNQYIVMIETTAGIGADDAIVAVGGFSGTTSFDAGTFLFNA